jgi:hypothetical protein
LRKKNDKLSPSRDASMIDDSMCVRGVIAAVVFLVISVGAALGQTSGKAANALRTAGEAWEKVYSAKDLAK